MKKKRNYKIYYKDLMKQEFLLNQNLQNYMKKKEKEELPYLLSITTVILYFKYGQKHIIDHIKI